MAASMKKTFYYNFFPTKAEEQEEAKKGGSSSGEKQISRVLIEMHDFPDNQPPLLLKHTDPRRIIKAVSVSEIQMGILFFSFSETFEHIFRHWTLDEVNLVQSGYNKFHVLVKDVTDHEETEYRSDRIFFQRLQNDEFYILGCLDVIRNRYLSAGDEIGLAWERDRNGTGMFLFKLLSRSKRAPPNIMF
ncbi:B3 domain-containing protein [Prunus yedoensis var. nudiflora]|uniref:B3 domain-containing protein n=1 Tax=Prunus yedoensis var. nudiflora TaxID=2094558 RepID=A0A314XSX0_PRUYE|nr:B3 domain-containing protein [Prunus yedoensis var. nudiflora]